MVYLTSGAGGGNVLVRQNEATNALKKLNLDNSNIIFANCPF